MWLFFRNDDFGLTPSKFDRLLALFEHYNHKLNAAVRPDLLNEALKSSLDQAKDFLQVVVQGMPGQEPDLLLLEQSFANFFPCYVGEKAPSGGGKPSGYKMTSSASAGALPNFGICLDLHEGERFSAKEIFKRLSIRNESAEFSGVRLQHSKMTEEDFATLEELLHNLYKRSIPTSFFSDFIPGYERYCEGDSGHV